MFLFNNRLYLFLYRTHVIYIPLLGSWSFRYIFGYFRNVSVTLLFSGFILK